MISPAYTITMANYNRWQNESVFAAADTLTPAERQRDRGAFFKSIEATLNHILWGDRIWLHRFAGTPLPRRANIAESVTECADWVELTHDRRATDAQIIQWSQSLDPAWLAGDLTWYSGAIGREVVKPRSLLVAHLFNHQTHHRGQVHAMLTAAGARPGATDLPFKPD